jgi:cytochrome b involved in lipid metabolism
MAQKSSPRIFTSLAEIFQHNTKESLWILIDNKVYDVTNFTSHPGKMTVLLNNGGQDATQQFEDIGHSKKALKMMQDFYIGDYVFNDKTGKKETFEYPKQQIEPEYSLGVRVALALGTILVMISLFIYLDRT